MRGWGAACVVCCTYGHFILCDWMGYACRPWREKGRYSMIRDYLSHESLMLWIFNIYVCDQRRFARW